MREIWHFNITFAKFTKYSDIMIKRLFSFVASVTVVLSAWAAKPTIYFQEFENSANVKDAWVEIVRGAVLEGLHATNRTNIIDAVTESSRYEEELRRLRDNLATDDLETTEALQTKGANVLVNGDVTALTVPGTKLDSGSMSYDATVTFTLRVVNALDGTLLGTKTFTLPKSVLGFSVTSLKTVSNSEDEAVQAIKGDITKAMKDFVDESFPITGALEDVESFSKNNKEVETFYVGLGSEDGLVKGQKLDAKLVQKIGKKTASKTIGEVEVVEIAGDDISLCKVKKGGAEIKNALDSKQTVIVSSKSKKR